MSLDALIGYEIPLNIDEIIRESIKLTAPLQHFVTIIIQCPKGIIQGISQSKPNNLILNNFGTWLAGLIRAPVNTDTTISLTDTGNNSRDTNTYDNQGACHVFNGHDGTITLGTQIQVGGGSTTAARTDYAIETPLSTSPEDALFDTGTGSYATGTISLAGAITAGGTETINEVILAAKWHYGAAASGNAVFALFHDILVSGEAFTPGQTITAAYTINL